MTRFNLHSVLLIASIPLDTSCSPYPGDTSTPSESEETVTVGVIPSLPPATTTPERTPEPTPTNTPQPTPTPPTPTPERTPFPGLDNDGDHWSSCPAGQEYSGYCDCDDNNSQVHPQAESIDGELDYDCDGQVEWYLRLFSPVKANCTATGDGHYLAYVENGYYYVIPPTGSHYESSDLVGGSTYNVEGREHSSFIVAGKHFYEDGSHYDAYLAKAQLDGTIHWETHLSTQENTGISQFEELSSGMFVLKGVIRQTTSGSGRHWFAGLSTDLQLVWQLEPFYSSDEIYTWGFARSSDSTTMYGYSDPWGEWLMRISDQGIVDWRRQVDVMGSMTSLETEDGVVVGRQESIVAYDIEGSELWQSYVTAKDEHVIHTVSNVSTGGYVAAGQRIRGDGQTYSFATRLDVDGNMLWYQTYGISGINVQGATDIDEAPDGGFIIFGNYEDPCSNEGCQDIVYGFALKTDAQGNAPLKSAEIGDTRQESR